MPARPSYFHRITEAIDVFRGIDADWVDRRTLEEVLGVSKTVAWRLIRRLGGREGPGGALACGRLDLIEALEAMMRDPAYEREIRRRGRLEEGLENLLAAARSRHVAIAPERRALELLSTRFGKLPPGVELGPARLTIDFFGTEDFLEKIGAVVFALQNDYEAISSFIEQRGLGGSASEMLSVMRTPGQGDVKSPRAG